MEAGWEVQLKLSVPSDRLESAASSPHLNSQDTQPPNERSLKDTYYDTPHLALRERGFALRIREADEQFVQTVKSGSAGVSGLFKRREWEQNVAGPKPDVAQFSDSALREQLSDVAVMLEPVFTSEVHRRIRTIEPGNAARVEVAIDHGHVTTPKGSVAIREIEFELKDGHPDTLYDLALALNEVVPVHLETTSKSDRGYALLAESVISWSKSPPLVLDPGMTGLDAFQAIQRHHLRHLLANEQAAREGHDPEGIHQVRVALRRLRSVLALFRSVLPSDSAQRLGEELRWLQRETSPARDLDVFLADLLRPVHEAMPQETGLDALQARAETARRASYEQVRAAFATARYTALLLEVSRFAETRGWLAGLGVETQERLNEPALKFANGVLAERHRKAMKRGRGFAKLTLDDRHRFRIGLKKLRYAADSFRSLYPGKPTADYIKRLARLQDLLGHLTDLVIARRLRDELLRSTATIIICASGVVAGWHAHAIAGLEPRLRKQRKAFKAARPFWQEEAI